jgi:hypothetical protein
VVVDEHVIEMIARRVAAILLQDEQRTAHASKRLVGADELAEMFSVSRKWVYDNAAFGARDTAQRLDALLRPNHTKQKAPQMRGFWRWARLVSNQRPLACESRSGRF